MSQILTCWRLAFFWAASHLFEHALAQDLLGGGGDSTCSCNCCTITARKAPLGGSDTTCSLNAADTEQCPQSCTNLPPLEAILSEQGTVQYERFCLASCIPGDGEKLGSSCRNLSPEEAEKLRTDGGNGQDPGILDHKKPEKVGEPLKNPDGPPEPPQLVDAEAMNEGGGGGGGGGGGDGDGAADAAAKKAEKDSGAMVAEASGKQAMAAGFEARLTEAEAISAQALSNANGDMSEAKNNAFMITQAQAQVKAAEVTAAIYAKSAQKAAARAQADMKEIMDIPKKAAELAAAEAKKEIQDKINEEHSNLLWVKSRLAAPGLPVPLAEAAVRAAQPYYSIMNKAIAMGNLYEANAHSLQDQAQTMQQQSREVASQAVGYQSAGYGDMASKLMAQAKQLLAGAQAKDAEARKAFEVAENVRKQIPNYQANAAAASARATSIANPAGQPPPALAPPGFLQMQPISPHTQ